MIDTSGINFKTEYDDNDLYALRNKCKNENPNASEEIIKNCMDRNLNSITAYSYERNFKINDIPFTVKLKPGKSFYQIHETNFVLELEKQGMQQSEINEIFDNVFHLVFLGPLRDKSTGLMSGAAKAYTELLLTIKKLSEQTKFNGVMFKPHEPAMGLIYEKFISLTDLKLIDYVNLGGRFNKLYLREKILNDLIKKYDDPNNPRLKK